MKLAYSLFSLLLVLGARGAAGEAPLTVLVLAGQSEMLDWHADAALLPSDPADASIRFYFHTGAPPLHPQFPPNFFNATSHDAWTVLRPQTQEPYHKFFRTFFGPEMSLARQLDRKGVRPLAIIKVGYFGTNLAEDWRPDAAAGNQLYALFSQQVTQALGRLKAEGRAFNVAGFFWMQGGSDAGRPGFAAAYGKNLSAFIARVRADFGTAETPFVIARISPRRPDKPSADRELIRAAQVAVADRQLQCAWIDADDVSYAEDGAHPDALGTITLGERLAAAWLKLSATAAKQPAPATRM